jgi:N-formylglutamate amidohydrolase
MKNNFKKNGNMRVRFETPEERTEIIRILEEQRDFRIDEDLKLLTEIHPYDTRTFDLNLKFKTYNYWIQPFIGAAMMSSGVRFYSAQEFFRIAELDFKVVPRYPVFHVPHNGWEFPEDLMESVCVPQDLFMKYHEEMRDTDITRVVPSAYRGGDMCHSFMVSRLLCDVERFIGSEEIMEQYGMGFCYEKVYDGTVIKHVTEELKEKTLKHYRDHHEWMDKICNRHPRILLFDTHSYSDRIVPTDFLQNGYSAPDLCIGTDDRFTPPELIEIVQKRFTDAGFSIGFNYPYSGCYIPNTVLSGKCSADMVAIMLEFHKRTYCDQKGQPIPEKTKGIAEIIRQIVVDCVTLG